MFILSPLSPSKQQIMIAIKDRDLVDSRELNGRELNQCELNKSCIIPTYGN